MVELLTQPPPPEVIARMTAIEGVRVVPTILATQQGPDRHLGPEAAGAVLILQATFVEPERANEFWATAAGLMERLAVAHFAALWEMNTPRQRVIFCQECDGVTPATAGVCSGCGTELFDPFADTAEVVR